MSLVLISCGDAEDAPQGSKVDARSEASKEKESAESYEDDFGGEFKPNMEQIRIAQFAKQVQSLSGIDSVIYYFEIDDSYYFIVTDGEWREFNPWDINKKIKPKCKYGLVDEIGNILIPIEQDKVYNYQQIVPGHLMVMEDSKYSFYSIEGKKDTTEYDWVYPTKIRNNHSAIASSSGSIGYVGKDAKFSSFDDKLQFNDPEVFNQIEFNWNAHAVHEFHTPWFSSITYEAISAAGVVEIPTHLLRFGIERHEKITDVKYTEKQRNNRDGFMGVDKHEVSLKDVLVLKDKVIGILTYLYEYSIDGRESVMREVRLSSVQEDGSSGASVKVLELSQYPICEGHTYRVVDSNLVEVSIVDEKETYGETTYSYFQVNDNGQIDTLNKSRKYDCSHYVQMNPSYFEGCYYKTLSPVGYDWRILKRTHMTIDEIDEMRNEIFAEHGYIFTTDKWKKFFEKKDWYKGEFDNVDDKLTVLEKYNLKIIEEVSIRLRNDPSLSRADTTQWYPGP